MKIPTAAEPRTRPDGQSIVQYVAAVRQAHSDRLDALQTLMDAAEFEGHDNLQASAQREADRHTDELRRLEVLSRMIEASNEYQESARKVDRTGVVNPATAWTPRSSFEEGRPLGREQRMADFVTSRGLVREEERNLSFGKYIRGLVTGNWAGADAERRAMAKGTLASGGYRVPTILAAELIDLARKQARVIEAGARIVPMENKVVDVAVARAKAFTVVSGVL